MLEQAWTVSELGAGLQISPNAARVLASLGLHRELSRVGVQPNALIFRHYRSARVIASARVGDAMIARYGAPYYHVHRADLVSLLLAACLDSSEIQVVTGAAIDRIEESVERVTAYAQGQSFAGSFLIGADGIHSFVREYLWGAEQPRFTGNVAWRALLPVRNIESVRYSNAGCVWWGPGKHFVHYRVRGGAYMNCICVVEKSSWRDESWSVRGDLAELQEDFAGWHADIEDLLAAVEPDSLFKWALYDRAPLSLWGRGRVSLLGDAAHPALPFMAQGAAMAIEDAAVLGNVFSQHVGAGRIAPGLSAYEQLRRSRTASVQAQSRRNAWIYHASGLVAMGRNMLAPWLGQALMDKIYRYDALAVGKTRN